MNGTRTLQPDGRFGVSSFDPLVDPSSNPHTLIGTCSERFFINKFSSKFKYCFNLKLFSLILETSIVWIISGYNAQRYLTRTGCLLRSCQEWSYIPDPFKLKFFL